MATAEPPQVATAALPSGTEQVPYELSSEKMMTDTILYIGLLFAIFYFLLIRPQQKRVKAHQEMLKTLQKGTRVITGGGIMGTIVKMEGDDVAVVEIAQNVKVRVSRGSISEVVTGAAADTANDN